MLTSENKSLVIYALDTEREAVDVWNESYMSGFYWFKRPSFHALYLRD